MRRPRTAVGWRQALLAACLGLAMLPGARAHDVGLSTVQAEVGGDIIALTTGFAPGDAKYFLPLDPRYDVPWTETQFESVRAPLLSVAPVLWEVAAGDVILAPSEARVELLPEDNVSFFLVYPIPPDSTRLTLRARKLGDLPAGHRQFVVVSDERGSMLTRKLLSAKDTVIEVPLAQAGAPSEGGLPVRAAEGEPAGEMTFPGFLKLGVEHIWTGYDHLLFLFALLVVCRSFRSMIAIITCFTLAHSITLALATLEWVSIPARLVEPAIAASIVFVGVENLWRRGEEPRGRWLLTFVFGLIHGFGFASVLRDLGVGRNGDGGIAMPLFSFNLGVELGQIAIAAVVLPLVWQLRKTDAFVRRVVPALSVIVAAAGGYWLLERTLLD